MGGGTPVNKLRLRGRTTSGVLTAQLLCLEDVNHAYLQEGVLLPNTTSRRFRSAQTWMKRQCSMGTKTRPWIFFDDHICTSGTKQGIILVGAIGLRTQTNAEMLVLILFRNALSTEGWASRKPLTESPNLVTNNWICYIDQFDINLRFRDSLNEYMLIGFRQKTQYRKLSLF